MSLSRLFASVFVSSLLAAFATAAPPFAEDFPTDTANWRFSTGTPLNYVGSGGPDGSGYITRTFAFSSLANPPAPAATTVTIFRAQEEFNSSGQAYVGDWLASHVDHVSAWVRHSASEPILFRGRFSGMDNFPGATAYQLTTVAPNVWTQITFDIDPTSPQFFQVPGQDQFEGSAFNDIFSEISHIQFGAIIPSSLQGSTTPVTFDLDRVRVTVVPEPATGGILALVCSPALGLLRRKA